MPVVIMSALRRLCAYLLDWLALDATLGIAGIDWIGGAAAPWEIRRVITRPAGGSGARWRRVEETEASKFTSRFGLFPLISPELDLELLSARFRNQEKHVKSFPKNIKNVMKLKFFFGFKIRNKNEAKP